MFSKSSFDNVHFVLGAPRSGTTWLMKALNFHPQIYCTENRLFGQFCQIWPNDDGTSNARITLDEYINISSGVMETELYGSDLDKIRNELMHQYLRGLFDVQRKLSGKKIIVDKVTPYVGRSILTLGKIREVFPDARIMQILRDGRDVITSGTFDWLLKDAAGTDRHEYFVNKITNPGLKRFFDNEVIELWAQYWTNPVVAFELIEPDTLLIRYEEMIDNQVQVLKKITGYLNISDDDKLLLECVNRSNFKVLSGGRNRGEEVATAKTRKGVVGDWKNYFTKQDGQLFDRLAGDILFKYGYENDRHWYEQLPEELSSGRK